MALRIARETLSRIFFQRCFYLFLLLLTLIAVAPFMPLTPTGRVVVNAINTFVVIATVAAVGRSHLSFLLVLLIAVPATAFQWIGIHQQNDDWLMRSWASGALLYLVTISYLLRYVFQREVMTADKLFGAAAAYLMLAIFFAYLYCIVGYHYPDSYQYSGKVGSLGFYDGICFSMTVLTSTGFGDITPLSGPARSVCMVEQVTGGLFLAILIARLAGVYRPAQGQERQRED